jgi:xanthosine utilization system XapX-like protein
MKTKHYIIVAGLLAGIFFAVLVLPRMHIRVQTSLVEASPLLVAITETASVDRIQQIVGADPLMISRDEASDEGRAMGGPLGLAAYMNATGIVSSLIANGANVEYAVERLKQSLGSEADIAIELIKQAQTQHFTGAAINGER